MVHIKQAGLAELDAVADLFNQYRIFYGQTSDLPLVKALIGECMDKNESVLLLATDDGGNVLGFTQLYPNFQQYQHVRYRCLMIYLSCTLQAGKVLGMH